MNVCVANNSRSENPAIKVAWISDFPIEWLPDLPEALRHLPKLHPATWMPVLLQEFERWSNLQLHIIVLRKSVTSDRTFERNGVTFHVLKTPAGLRAPSLFWVDTVLIRKVLRRINPDLVHAWGTERGASLVASRLGCPFVVTMQGLLSWYQDLIPFGMHDRFAAFTERMSLQRACVVTTESVFAVNYLRERYPQLHVRQAEHAPNRIFQQVRRSPHLAPVRFLTVGTFGYRKGSDLLLHALGRLCDEFPFECIIVGHPDESFLKPLRRELPSRLWDRIQFKPGLRPAEVAAELANATMAVLPTRADTSPNAVKEAVVAGVPVVATRVGGIPDYVFHGENGLLCPSNDPVALTDVLRQAVHHPNFSKGLVQTETLTRMRAYLSPEQMARNFFEAYQAVLGQSA